jgi:drug/metabolite transporter (DMT)-like permease
VSGGTHDQVWQRDHGDSGGATAALFANAVPYLLFAVAEQTVTSSTAGIFNATTPLWTVMLALTARHQNSVRVALSRHEVGVVQLSTVAFLVYGRDLLVMLLGRTGGAVLAWTGHSGRC